MGLNGCDGLAMSPDGLLFVAEENTGCISSVSQEGIATSFAEGLNCPEGIAFNSSGFLYAVEDVQDGSLFSFDPSGTATELFSGLDAPEGVTVEQDGSILCTESTVQFADRLWDYKTSVTRISIGGIEQEVNMSLFLWSYSGITTDWAGTVYVSNEASGIGTENSIFKIDPVTGIRTLFSRGLTACEGLCFSPGGRFPLYAVEEDLGSGNGVLSVIGSDGTHQPFATGFFNIEDVLVDENGRIFVTEDTTGIIILLEH